MKRIYLAIQVRAIFVWWLLNIIAFLVILIFVGIYDHAKAYKLLKAVMSDPATEFNFCRKKWQFIPFSRN